MSFEVPEETEALRKSLRRFAEDEVIPLERENNLTWDVPPPKELRRQVRLRSKELGLYGADMPIEVGGGGISFSARCLLEMEVHYHDTVFSEDMLGGGCGPTSVLLACTDVQKQQFLFPLMNGETTTCFALSEADAGSDVNHLRTRAQKTEGGYVINGAKNIISNAIQADFAMVFVSTNPELGLKGGVTCLLIDKETPGFSVGREHTCMGFTGFQGELVFQDCRVPEGAVLGQEGLGMLPALDWINGNRVRTGAMSSGIARRLLERSASYAKGREQFGAPIASYQAVQLKLADMAAELFAAESMVMRTAGMRDRGCDIRKEASITKVYCTEMVNRAAYEAVQIHGGVGCLREAGIERVYRMVRILTILEGTSEIQRLTVARRVLKEVA
jgi:alkylation response protein AidB-like acyl-CoA dehydrogenase